MQLCTTLAMWWIALQMRRGTPVTESMLPSLLEASLSKMMKVHSAWCSRSKSVAQASFLLGFSVLQNSAAMHIS